MLVVFDHTERSWAIRKRRENGAATYSRDLVKYQIPNWHLVNIEGKNAISTCAKFSKIRSIRRFSREVQYIQYLHTYPYQNPLSDIRRISMACRSKVRFLTAYKSFQVIMESKGINATWVPMAIDVAEVSKYNTGQKRCEDKIIYFGNLYRDKHDQFEDLQQLCRSVGLTMDYISDGCFNGDKKVSQEEAWKIISTYKYGIGVGRCALEMYALGLKVLIAGNQFGGIVIDEADWNVQEKTNFNGRVITFDRDVKACLESLDKSLVCNLLVRDIAKENHALYK